MRMPITGVHRPSAVNAGNIDIYMARSKGGSAGDAAPGLQRAYVLGLHVNRRGVPMPIDAGVTFPTRIKSTPSVSGHGYAAVGISFSSQATQKPSSVNPRARCRSFSSTIPCASAAGTRDQAA